MPDLPFSFLTEMHSVKNQNVDVMASLFALQCLTWPDQKLDDRSRKYSIFPSDNARIEDPVRLLKHEADMRPWSDEEKKIFLDKYLSHVKARV